MVEPSSVHIWGLVGTDGVTLGSGTHSYSGQLGSSSSAYRLYLGDDSVSGLIWGFESMSLADLSPTILAVYPVGQDGIEQTSVSSSSTHL